MVVFTWHDSNIDFASEWGLQILMRMFTEEIFLSQPVSQSVSYRVNGPLVDGHVPEEFMQSLRRYIGQMNGVTFVSERTAEHGPEHRVARYQHILVRRKCNTAAIC